VIEASVTATQAQVQAAAQATEAAPITIVSGGKTAPATVAADLGAATETDAPTPVPTAADKGDDSFGCVAVLSSLFLLWF
jgi:hypothetical protein